MFRTQFAPRGVGLGVPTSVLGTRELDMDVGRWRVVGCVVRSFTPLLVTQRLGKWEVLLRMKRPWLYGLRRRIPPPWVRRRVTFVPRKNRVVVVTRWTLVFRSLSPRKRRWMVVCSGGVRTKIRRGWGRLEEVVEQWTRFRNRWRNTSIDLCDSLLDR